MSKRLLFVYNADSGLFNTLGDIGHKIFSPETYSCKLCALSYGYLKEKKEWRDFIESLSIPCDFLHRDEFIKAYPGSVLALPAVFLLDKGGLVPCLDASAINRCGSIDDLQQEIRRHCVN
jgi:hypothetical protein